jgi:hypothetical protein
LRTRISTTKTLHDTAMLTKLNTVAMTCGYMASEGTWAINVLARRWDPVPVAVKRGGRGVYLYKITYLAGDWVLVPNDVEDEEGEHVAGVREGRVEVDALLQFVLQVALLVSLRGRARLAAGGPAPASPFLRRGGRLVVCAAGVGGLLLPSLGIYWGALN